MDLLQKDDAILVRNGIVYYGAVITEVVPDDSTAHKQYYRGLWYDIPKLGFYHSHPTGYDYGVHTSSAIYVDDITRVLDKCKVVDVGGNEVLIEPPDENNPSRERNKCRRTHVCFPQLAEYREFLYIKSSGINKTKKGTKK